MLVRMKYKYFNGFTKRANAQESGTPLQDDPVLKGCMFESERRKLKAALGAEDITQEKYKDSLRALWKGHKRRQAPALIRLELKHGDLLVMHGNRLQQFFEVCGCSHFYRS